MAINHAEFINKIDVGLKANNTFYRFLYRFKINGKPYNQIFDYTEKLWDKRTRISKVKTDAYNYRESKKENFSNIDENIRFDIFINQYFETMETSKSYSGNKWQGEIKSFYNRYMKKDIGQKKIKDIRQMDIKDIIKNIKDLGLKERTQKITIEILNPVFKSAIANRLIIHNPCNGITITRPKTRKKVQNASQLLKKIYDAILLTFNEEPYFQALYLFALQGRRKSEILTLKWENIDFNNNYYTLLITKNGEEQTFSLPQNIANILLSFKSNKSHYVFESPFDETKYIQNIQGQTNKLKKALNNPNFGIHYLRNVVVSAMAEKGIDSTYLSGALGHSDLTTIKKYVSIPYQEGSKIANQTIKEITEN